MVKSTESKLEPTQAAEIKQGEPTNKSLSPENNICAICSANKLPPPCKGHGGGGSGDNNSGSDSENTFGKENNTKNVSSTPVDIIDTENSKVIFQPTMSGTKIFNAEIISALFSNAFSSITHDENSKTLTIKLQCSIDALPEDQKHVWKNYIDAILKALSYFKMKKNISANCATLEKDDQGHILSLRIKLPTPALCNEFIQHLIHKSLTPRPIPSTKKSLEDAEEMISLSSRQLRSPFSIEGPKPKGYT